VLVTTFNDILGESNFHIIGGNVYNIKNVNHDKALDYGSERFATDKLTDGIRIKANVANIFSFEDAKVQLKIANVEEILYRSLFVSYSNRENNNNPFYENIIPPNNIKGEKGNGVFAGYQLFEEEIIINDL